MQILIVFFFLSMVVPSTCSMISKISCISWADVVSFGFVVLLFNIKLAKCFLTFFTCALCVVLTTINISCPSGPFDGSCFGSIISQVTFKGWTLLAIWTTRPPNISSMFSQNLPLPNMRIWVTWNWLQKSTVLRILVLVTPCKWNSITPLIFGICISSLFMFTFPLSVTGWLALDMKLKIHDGNL